MHMHCENVHYTFVGFPVTICLIEYLIQQWLVSYNYLTRIITSVFQILNESAL